MRRAIVAFVALLAAVSPTAAAAKGAGDPPPSRCEVAGDLIRAGKRDVGVEQLTKGLDRPATRACARDALIALQEPPPAATRCDAAGKLRRHGDLLDEAKAQYEKALDEDSQRACAVRGLVVV